MTWRTQSERIALAEQQRQLDPRQATLLPAGTDWYDFWTGDRHSGDASTARRYAIGEFPLFVRAGSILPLGPVVQHFDEESVLAPGSIERVEALGSAESLPFERSRKGLEIRLPDGLAGQAAVALKLRGQGLT